MLSFNELMSTKKVIANIDALKGGTNKPKEPKPQPKSPPPKKKLEYED